MHATLHNIVAANLSSAVLPTRVRPLSNGGNFRTSHSLGSVLICCMPTERLKRSLRTTFTGLAVNAVLATGKLLAGIFGHSHALVADAVESLADVFSSLVVWRALVV